jgi:FkbM family methyltransferase
MIFFDEWVLPNGETHLQEWMTVVGQRVEGRLTYQYHKYSAAMKFCGQRRRAVDAGAHVGLWSYWMAGDFQKLEAFEPIKEHQECWTCNMMGRRGQATLHKMGLGAKPGMASFSADEISSGSTFLDPKKETDKVLIGTLDGFKWEDVDFLKIDVEGTELDVIQGGLETIRRCRPLIVVEQKGNEVTHYGRKRNEAVAFLTKLGMKPLRPALSDDWIMGWP